jgi:hypothetical protein
LLLHAILSLSFSQSIYSVSMLYLTDIQAVLSGASNIPYSTYVVSTSVQTWRPEIHRCSTYFKAPFFFCSNKQQNENCSTNISQIGYWTRILQVVWLPFPSFLGTLTSVQATDVLNRSEVLIVGTHADQVPDQVVLDTLKFVEYHILARMRASRAIPSERLLSVALPPSGSSSSFSTRSRGVQEVASMVSSLTVDSVRYSIVR